MADDAFVTQVALELANQFPGSIRVTQLVVEVLRPNPASIDTRVTQAVIELSAQHSSESRLTQLLIEIMISARPSSGIYKMVKGKTDDTHYTVGTATIDVKIPDPFVITFLAGDSNG